MILLTFLLLANTFSAASTLTAVRCLPTNRRSFPRTGRLCPRVQPVP